MNSIIKKQKNWVLLSWVTEEAQTAMGDHDSVIPVEIR